MNINDIRRVMRLKKGNANIYLEEMFTICVTREALIMSNGCLKKAGDILGLGDGSIRRRVKLYDLEEFRVNLVEKHEKANERRRIMYAIEKRGDMSSAARFLHWDLTTLKQRMKSLGMTLG